MAKNPEIAKVTQLLIEWNGGRKDALEDLMPLVYGELRRLAANRLRNERPITPSSRQRWFTKLTFD
jgi:hypothetical protein